MKAAAKAYDSNMANYNLRVLDAIRYGNSGYRASKFTPFSGAIDTSFITYLKTNYLELYNYFCVSPLYGYDPTGFLVDWAHFAVSLQGVMIDAIHHGKEYVNWAGDLSTAMSDVQYNGASASTVIGNSNYSFPKEDLQEKGCLS